MSVPDSTPFVLAPGEGRGPTPVSEAPTPSGPTRIEVKLDRHDGERFFSEVVEEVTAAGGPSPEVMGRVVPVVRERYGDEGHPGG